jgi:VIT1/CCC1 family predicted Fe2+/Mn2+ transporter
MDNKNEAYKIEQEKQHTERYKAGLELIKQTPVNNTQLIIYIVSAFVFIILIFSIDQITQGNTCIGLSLLSTLVGTGLGLLAGKNLNDTKKSK